jgi:hypothetical protein
MAEADGEEPAANVTRTQSLGETLRLMQESGAGGAQLTAKAPRGILPSRSDTLPASGDDLSILCCRHAAHYPILGSLDSLCSGGSVPGGVWSLS